MYTKASQASKLKKLLPKAVKIKLIFLRDFLKLVYGIVEYKISNKPYHNRTSQKTNVAMANLFCHTEGKSNDFLSMLISAKKNKINLLHSNGILGNLSKVDLKSITFSLNENGYYIFKNKLPSAMIEKLLNTAKSTKLVLNASDEEQENGVVLQREEYYDPQHPKSTKYFLDNNLCVNNDTIQEIYSDFSVLSVAQAYLKSMPKLDMLGLWWNTKFSDKPSKAAAEYFHFDLDRPKWLKFFIYLTDVDENNGPHQFIKGTHRTAGIPKQLLKKGYSRLTDEEIYTYFGEKDIMRFIAEKGTIIAEDTRGLHKASKVLNKDRLILQIQFSNSLFGTTVPAAEISKINSKNLNYLMNTSPEIFSLYVNNTDLTSKGL
jgi:ectoine hydroxylase-related dioxygenase (phytanoyl-CoA dioxygenase family)